MKVGLNKWDLVTDVDMTPVDYLPVSCSRAAARLALSSEHRKHRRAPGGALTVSAMLNGVLAFALSCCRSKTSTNTGTK